MQKSTQTCTSEIADGVLLGHKPLDHIREESLDLVAAIRDRNVNCARKGGNCKLLLMGFAAIWGVSMVSMDTTDPWMFQVSIVAAGTCICNKRVI